MRNLLSIVAMISLAAGCQTEFTGAPTVPGGRPACERVCASYGMRLAGMVAMGAGYTDGCICAVSDAPQSQSAVMSSGAIAGAVVGVITAERRRSQQQQRH